MPEVSCSCISNSLKFILNDRLKSTAEVSKTAKDYLDYVNGLPECDGRTHEQRGMAKEGEPKKERKKSKYNLFIGECMRSKSGPHTERMRSCAAEWKKKK